MGTLGWRARLGVILPALNFTMEPEFYKMMPEGVTAHFTRVQSGPLETEEQYKAMMEANVRAAHELADVPVDVISLSCTSCSWFAPQTYDKDFAKLIYDEVKIPAVTTSTGCVDALKELKMQRFPMLLPYVDWMNKKGAEYFKIQGFDVLDWKSPYQLLDIDMKTSEKLDFLSNPEYVYRCARKVWKPDADGLFISCTGWAAIEAIESIERDLGKPAISATTALFWKMLKMVGVSTSIKGYGELLETHL